MKTKAVSSRIPELLDAMSPIIHFFTESEWASRFGDPYICDFTIGNPHDMPLPDFVEALQHWSVPKDRYWYAYKMNEESSRKIVADSLLKWREVAYNTEDIFMTNGATAGLALSLGAIIDPGDEVIYISPPWFQYEGMIANAGGVPMKVRMDMNSFDLDLVAIEDAISKKTRGIIINSPHNPSGKIYPPETLSALSRILTEASDCNGRPIYLISDESYSRIVFDGRKYHSPTSFYPNSFLVYTYSKVLLTPGQRIGFLAMPPEMPSRHEFHSAIYALQMLNGWLFPNALLQHALADLENISMDIGHLQNKRDRMTGALKDMGYEVSIPEGTFYVICKSPLTDDKAFVNILAEMNIFCIPGSLMDIPGYFRISLTAGDDMIERALPGFGAAVKKVKSF